MIVHHPHGDAILQPSFNTSAAAPDYFSLRGATPWLIERSLGACRAGSDENCYLDKLHVMLLFIVLSSLVISVTCSIYFMRDIKEGDIPPLCPQLVVQSNDTFSFPAHLLEEDDFCILDSQGNKWLRIVTEGPSGTALHHGAHGVAATIRLLGCNDRLLALVLAKAGQQQQKFAICRPNRDLFGFVDVETEGRRFQVNHRNSVHLLTIETKGNDFSGATEVEALDPLGAQISWLRHEEGKCSIHAKAHVDLGLVICALLAARYQMNSNLTPTSGVAEGEGQAASNKDAGP
jgi:hypothetical protein